MKSFDLHGINKFPSDGYLIFPISMSRINKGQNPEEIYGVIKSFEKKISAVGIDAIILYTNGLYYNNDESALTVRKRTNGQMLSHRNAFLKLVSRDKKYIPQAIHFLPWDFVILNFSQYEDYFQKLIKLKDTDKKFKDLLKDGLNGRKENEANINFLVEEIVVSHIIRQKLIEFPKTLVKQDKFRLMVYPGLFFKADLYQWKKKILPQKETKNDNSNPYYASHYDSEKNILYNFDDLELQQFL